MLQKRLFTVVSFIIKYNWEEIGKQILVDKQNGILVSYSKLCWINNSMEYYIKPNTTSFLKQTEVLVTQSCPTLCNSTDCSSSGSSVHGILLARILE